MHLLAVGARRQDDGAIVAAGCNNLVIVTPGERVDLLAVGGVRPREEDRRLYAGAAARRSVVVVALGLRDVVDEYLRAARYDALRR